MLPCAPRPIPGELRSTWLHRMAAANVIMFPELLEAFATRLLADLPEQIWFDDILPPAVGERLAAWCWSIKQSTDHRAAHANVRAVNAGMSN